LDIFTIGFAGKTAEQFFESLTKAGVKQLVDVRLNNVSQLAGFTKNTDLPYFLDRLAELSTGTSLCSRPTRDMFKAYRAREDRLGGLREAYHHLLFDRDVAAKLSPQDFRVHRLALQRVLAERCHRRLAAEHLR
jgi:uncharacterized protein (DUF488 family)